MVRLHAPQRGAYRLTLRDCIGGRRLLPIYLVRLWPGAASSQHAHGLVHGDPVDPGLQAAVAAEARQRPKCPHERRLSRILCIVHVAQHAMTVRIDAALVFAKEAFERVLAIRTGRGQGWGLQRR